MRSPRSPHSVHGLPTCIWTRDAGVIAIVRAKFVILGALSPGQKWRLYFRGFPPGFPSFFTATRTILREFWALRRPRERGPSLDDLPPPFSLSPLFLPFFSLSSPPSATAGKKLPYCWFPSQSFSPPPPLQVCIKWFWCTLGTTMHRTMLPTCK